MVCRISGVHRDSPPIQLQAINQHLSNDEEATPQTTVTFGQIYLSKPTHWESDGSSAPMMPNEARLRNLTYWAAVYVDIKTTIEYPDGLDKLKDGGRVRVEGYQSEGTIRYVPDDKENEDYGVELDDAAGDGTDGMPHFDCADGHGIYVTRDKFILGQTDIAEKTPIGKVIWTWGLI